MKVTFKSITLPADYPERISQASGYPIRFAQGFTLGMIAALEGKLPHQRVFFNGSSTFAAGYRFGYTLHNRK